MPNINVKDIKVVKLINGDDILCYLPTGTEQLPENGPLLRLVKPLQIRYVPSFTEEGLKDYIAHHDCRDDCRLYLHDEYFV